MWSGLSRVAEPSGGPLLEHIVLAAHILMAPEAGFDFKSVLWRRGYDGSFYKTGIRGR